MPALALLVAFIAALKIIVTMTGSPTHSDYVPLVEPKKRARPEDDHPDTPGIPFLIKLGAFLALVCGLLCIGYMLLPVEPAFSNKITGIHGLEDLHMPKAISPQFNVTIHADNTQSMLWQDCRPKSAVTMYHDDNALAWGELPAFCVDRRSALDLDVSLSGDSEFLPRKVREDLMSDLWTTGAVHLRLVVEASNPEDTAMACLGDGNFAFATRTDGPRSQYV